MKNSSKILAALILLLAMTLTLKNYAQVQPYFGGVEVGSSAPEGFHFSLVYLPVMGNQLNDADGNAMTSMPMQLDPTMDPVNMDLDFDLNWQPIGINLFYRSSKKILGANFAAFMVAPYSVSKKVSFTATAPDGTVITLEDSHASGLIAIMLSPVNLIWSQPRYVVSAGLGINLPVGSYDAGSPSRWAFLPTLGGTYYFDNEKSLSASTKLTYEINGKQLNDDADMSVGDELIVEWGIGKMIIPFGRFGVIGYSDFQVTDDMVAGVTSDIRHSTHSVGLEYMMYLPPAKLAITLKALKGVAAKDAVPVTQFFVAITKTLYNAK